MGSPGTGPAHSIGRISAIGFVADVPFVMTRSVLGPGETLLVYSDGAIEEENRAGEAFGVSRLTDAIAAASPAMTGEDALAKALEATRAAVEASVVAAPRPTT